MSIKLPTGLFIGDNDRNGIDPGQGSGGFRSGGIGGRPGINGFSSENSSSFTKLDQSCERDGKRTANNRGGSCLGGGGR